MTNNELLIIKKRQLSTRGIGSALKDLEGSFHESVPALQRLTKKWEEIQDTIVDVYSDVRLSNGDYLIVTGMVVQKTPSGKLKLRPLLTNWVLVAREDALPVLRKLSDGKYASSTKLLSYDDMLELKRTIRGSDRRDDPNARNLGDLRDLGGLGDRQLNFAKTNQQRRTEQIREVRNELRRLERMGKEDLVREYRAVTGDDTSISRIMRSNRSKDIINAILTKTRL